MNHPGIQSITLLGSSSGRNAGDAALVAAIMDNMDCALGRRIRYEIPSPCPAYIRDHYPNDARPIGIMPWQASIKMLGRPTLRSILRTDLTLIFEAILFDRSLFNPLFNFLSTLYLLLPIARRRGKRMACYDVGVGPIHTRAGRHMLTRVLGCMDFITVRDEEALDLLRENGMTHPRVRLAADTALNAPVPDAARLERACPAPRGAGAAYPAPRPAGRAIRGPRRGHGQGGGFGYSAANMACLNTDSKERISPRRQVRKEKNR